MLTIDTFLSEVEVSTFLFYSLPTATLRRLVAPVAGSVFLLCRNRYIRTFGRRFVVKLSADLVGLIRTCSIFDK